MSNTFKIAKSKNSGKYQIQEQTKRHFLWWTWKEWKSLGWICALDMDVAEYDSVVEARRAFMRMLKGRNLGWVNLEYGELK